MAAKMVQPSAYMSRASKIDGPGACGMDYPFRVTAFSAGLVATAQQPAAAQALVAFLASAEAHPVIRSTGLDPAGEVRK